MRPRPPIIFFAEDNSILLQTVRDVLVFAGWYVKPCEDSCMALALVESPEYFDLLILDDEMPGFKGSEIARRARLKEHRRQTPIVLISLYDREEEARSLGVDAFLRKPYNLIDLVDTVRRLLAAAQPV